MWTDIEHEIVTGLKRRALFADKQNDGCENQDGTIDVEKKKREKRSSQQPSYISSALETYPY